MRLESLRYTERFGSIRINDLQKVLELDSGKKCETPRKEEIAVHKIEDEVIKDIEGRMAVIIPIKDEKLKLFEGVISGIPLKKADVQSFSGFMKKHLQTYSVLEE